MPDAPNDLFARYYAEKLWEMIPPVYRHEDGIADRPGVLRALIEVMADQAAIVRRSNDRAWEDQFVDLSDDWAVSYMGDLLGTRMVSALDLRGRRADVANTIFYRRRAGTLAVLEGLIADITGWEGTVVEEYQRLVRHPHGLDPAPTRVGTRTDTPAHGLPDMRQPRGSQLAWGPWDEFHHLPDMRANRGGTDGRYGISKLAFHIFRLQAFAVSRVMPRLLLADATGKQRFSFDPSGRVIPLFQRHTRPAFAFDWRAALEWELPAPIRCEALASAEYVVREAHILGWLSDSVVTAAEASELRSLLGIRFPSEARFRTRLGALPTSSLGLAALHRVLADSLTADCGKGVLLPSQSADVSGAPSSVVVERVANGKLRPVARELTVAGNLSAGVINPTDKTLVIDAENGLGFFTAGTPPPSTVSSYAYGFSGDVGAGPYPRPGLPSVPPAGHASGGGALAGPVGGSDAALEIDDSATYGPVANIAVTGSAILQARSGQRPYLELASDWTLTTNQADSVLTLDGLWVGGRGPRTIHLAAQAAAGWKSVSLMRATLDPGGTDADAGPLGPVVLSIESVVADLTIDSSIVGPVVVTGSGLVERLTIRRSILHSIDPVGRPVVLAQPRGTLNIRGTTVIGQMKVHQLDASELLCTDTIVVDDRQSGCVRFSAFAPGSQVPRPYRTQSVTDPLSLFTSTRFGDPGYGQLSDLAPDTILRGGDDGTEIGAFSSLLNSVKLDSLKAKVDEFLPFGLIPSFITET